MSFRGAEAKRKQNPESITKDWGAWIPGARPSAFGPTASPWNDADIGPSRDDVWGQLVLNIRDAVAQLELALLEPLDLELIGAGGVLEG